MVMPPDWVLALQSDKRRGGGSALGPFLVFGEFLKPWDEAKVKSAALRHPGEVPDPFFVRELLFTLFVSDLEFRSWPRGRRRRRAQRAVLIISRTERTDRRTQTGEIPALQTPLRLLSVFCPLS